MQLKDHKWIVLFMGFLMTSTTHSQYRDDSEYYYTDPDMDDSISLSSEIHQRPKKYFYSGIPRSIIPYAEPAFAANPIERETEKPSSTPECIPVSGGEVTTTIPKEGAFSTTISSEVGSTTLSPAGESNVTMEVGAASTHASAASGTSTAVPPHLPQQPQQPPAEGGAPSAGSATETTAQPPPPEASGSSDGSGGVNTKSKELHILVQHLYIAQARVQLEATEIKKAQAVANSAQQQLEEAANHVRAITAALQNAQQEVAGAAIRAQTAQLQLAAHDQLLFAARQDVDALSSQMVGLQAAEGISAPPLNFDVPGLLDKLKKPLMEGDKPTPIPPIVKPISLMSKAGDSQSSSTQKSKEQRHNDNSNCVLQDFYYE